MSAVDHGILPCVLHAFEVGGPLSLNNVRESGWIIRLGRGMRLGARPHLVACRSASPDMRYRPMCQARLVSRSTLLRGFLHGPYKMRGTQFAELTAFAAVAEHGNFAK